MEKIASAIRTNNTALTLHAEIPALVKTLGSLQDNIVDLESSISGAVKPGSKASEAAAAAEAARKKAAAKKPATKKRAPAKGASRKATGATAQQKGGGKKPSVPRQGPAKSKARKDAMHEWPFADPMSGVPPGAWMAGFAPPYAFAGYPGFYVGPTGEELTTKAPQPRKGGSDDSVGGGDGQSGGKSATSKTASKGKGKKKRPEVYGDYPDWWGTGALHRASRTAPSSKTRSNPRMAYSATGSTASPAGSTAGSEDVTKDDLATAKYVRTKGGGGYGQAAQRAADRDKKAAGAAASEDSDSASGDTVDPAAWSPYGAPYPTMPYTPYGPWGYPPPMYGYGGPQMQYLAAAAAQAKGLTKRGRRSASADAKARNRSSGGGRGTRSSSAGARRPSSASVASTTSNDSRTHRAKADRAAAGRSSTRTPAPRTSHAARSGKPRAAPKHVRGVKSKIKSDLDARKAAFARAKRAQKQATAQDEYGPDGTLDGRPPSRAAHRRGSGGSGGNVLDIADAFLEGPVVAEFTGDTDPWGSLLQGLGPDADFPSRAAEGGGGGGVGIGAAGERRTVSWQEAAGSGNTEGKPPTDAGGKALRQRHEAWVGDYGGPQTQSVRAQAALSSDDDGSDVREAWSDAENALDFREIAAEADRQAKAKAGSDDDA